MNSVYTDANRTIQQTVQTIAERFHPEKIILFGSRAWGTAHQDSDVDLLIIQDGKDTRAIAREIDKALFPRTMPIDILVCQSDDIEQRQRMKDTFITTILTEGKTLYDRHIA